MERIDNKTNGKEYGKNADGNTKRNGIKGGRLTLTKLNILLWGIIALVAVIAIVRFCKAAEGTKAEVVVDEKIDITPTLITAMKEIGEWEFLSINDEEIVDTLKKGFFSDSRLVRIYYGKLSIGINMRKAEPHWVEQSGDSILITLPPVELLDNDFIDEARTKAFIETGNWTDADREILYRKAYDKMKHRCMTPANMQTARANAEEQFGKIIKALGIEKYSIKWKE